MICPAHCDCKWERIHTHREYEELRKKPDPHWIWWISFTWATLAPELPWLFYPSLLLAPADPQSGLTLLLCWSLCRLLLAMLNFLSVLKTVCINPSPDPSHLHSTLQRTERGCMHVISPSTARSLHPFYRWWNKKSSEDRICPMWARTGREPRLLTPGPSSLWSPYCFGN